MMREHPILFSGPMVRAILTGQKTQTRRVIKPQPSMEQDCEPEGYSWIPIYKGRALSVHQCPYGQPGDRLWVREAWADDVEAQWEPQKRGTYYRADDDAEDIKADCDDAGIPFVWRPSIHMHRWRSRITLEITGVRVQRLQDISEEDAFAEGIQRLENHSWGAEPAKPLGTYRGLDEWSEREGFWTDAVSAYAALWESINGTGSWDANPWVWVVEFRRIDP